MPTMNIYASKQILLKFDEEKKNNLKKFVAEQLTCREAQLNREDISMRLVEVFSPRDMKAALECNIVAQDFSARVEKRYEISQKISDFLLEGLEGIKDVKVWLELQRLWTNR